MQEKTFWQNVLLLLQKRIPKPSFDTFFRQLEILEKNPKEIILACPSVFAKEFLEKKFKKEILEITKQIDPQIEKIKLIISSSKNQKNQFFKRSFNNGIFSFSKSGLSPKYSFSNFVISSFNLLAGNCAKGIVENPGKLYNPFFVYSPVGLGKTHLLQAIGNEIFRKKTKKVKYVSCPELTNEIISSLRQKNTEEIAKEYKNFEVLIVDDIEYLEGKEKTQDVFFQIFESLVHYQKQIVLSSDRPPKALEIEKRLKSRFEGGMIADISFPSYEERLAILEKKLEEKEGNLPYEILEFIAKNIKKNIRELEGALNFALVFFLQEKSIEKTKKKLKDHFEKKEKKPSVEEVIKKIAQFYKLQKEDILSSSRKKEISQARQIIAFFLRKKLNLSLPAIGIKLGNKDHTSIGYAIKKVEEKIEKDVNFQKEIEEIEKEFFDF